MEIEEPVIEREVCFVKCWAKVKENKQQIASLAAVVFGIALGMILKATVTLTEKQTLYLEFPGVILIRLLQGVSLSLIVSGVVIGTTSVTSATSRKITTQACLYIVSTTTLSVALGLILVMVFKPGISTTAAHADTNIDESAPASVIFLDLLWNVVPEGVIQAGFQQYHTEIVDTEDDHHMNSTEVQLVGMYTDGVNILGLIFCSFVFGIILNTFREEERKVLIDICIAVNESTKLVVNVIMWYMPVGVMFMITCHIIETHAWSTFVKLGNLMAVIMVGLIIHGLIVLPMIYFLFVRSNPFSVIKAVSRALLTALLISSSSATVPYTLHCCEERLKIDKKITRLMLPIMTTVNMNGTALYEVVAAVFIPQFNGIYLDVGMMISLFLMAIVSSLRSAGVPATGAATTIVILTAVGLPAKDATILVTVEWLLDRFNTMVNVLGDCLGMALLDQLAKKEARKKEEEMSGDEVC